ncbi:DnaT-like ssDNA-binding protein [Meiothermus granaticius]|uniref:Putative DnaT-like domain-containing protein n=1 Tax=Meiothermus granaticius NBRC 107808 TaxID=1227551 RepID=A0A399FCN2_9DEIN|nr:DnaT-like ssDNA-binding protein [Meiothermus granaticius]RIH93993.1 hypothetical protein Mgrana_00079 [Meiothermus granaticius NBRC 107808]GEM88178.1 hypothetical protein MGR01S_28030 [Meiothermus granaticius NBRC 107808]
MSLTVGQNSYVSLEEANTYLAARLGAEAWAAAAEAQREAALITAARAIDRLPIIGRPVMPNQPMQFPRIWPPSMFIRRRRNDPFYDPEFPPDPLLYSATLQTGIPQDVKRAQCEEALALLNLSDGDRTRQRLQAQGVTMFRLGRLEESYGKTRRGPNALNSLEARDLLRPFVATSVLIV